MVVQTIWKGLLVLAVILLLLFALFLYFKPSEDNFVECPSGHTMPTASKCPKTFEIIIEDQTVRVSPNSQHIFYILPRPENQKQNNRCSIYGEISSAGELEASIVRAADIETFVGGGSASIEVKKGRSIKFSFDERNEELAVVVKNIGPITTTASVNFRYRCSIT